MKTNEFEQIMQNHSYWNNLNKNRKFKNDILNKPCKNNEVETKKSL